jgi:hypothetical protein
MKPKIILHCGAQKTGASRIQQLFLANIDRLAQAGYDCPAGSRNARVRDDIRIMLGDVLRPQNDNQNFLYRIRAVLQEIQATRGAQTLIIANESMLGRPFTARQSGFYARADDLAQRIRLALDEYDVEIRFVIRDYSTFLPSWYVQSVRTGSRRTFEDFVMASDFASVDWNVPVRAMRRHFGADNVSVYDHADLVRDSHAFLSAMFPGVMAALGDHGHELNDKTRSIGRGMVEAYRCWNEISQRFVPNAEAHRIIHHIGRRYLIQPFERFSKSEKLRLPPEMAAELTARFKLHAAAIQPRPVLAGDLQALQHAAQ